MTHTAFLPSVMLGPLPCCARVEPRRAETPPRARPRLAAMRCRSEVKAGDTLSRRAAAGPPAHSVIRTCHAVSRVLGTLSGRQAVKATQGIERARLGAPAM